MGLSLPRLRQPMHRSRHREAAPQARHRRYPRVGFVVISPAIAMAKPDLRTFFVASPFRALRVASRSIGKSTGASEETAAVRRERTRVAPAARSGPLAQAARRGWRTPLPRSVTSPGRLPHEAVGLERWVGRSPLRGFHLAAQLVLAGLRSDAVLLSLEPDRRCDVRRHPSEVVEPRKEGRGWIRKRR